MALSKMLSHGTMTPMSITWKSGKKLVAKGEPSGEDLPTTGLLGVLYDTPYNRY